MLLKISIRNIIKSIKDYAIYFFTLILGVAIFYVFNAIDSQTVMMNVTSSTYEIIELMTNILSGVSVFISFVLGFLVIYASRFLIKRRNKEFGIYLTLGMSKRKLSFILFLETFIIGLLSLVVGLFLGVVLSQFMSILVANMFEADLTKFEFIFSQSACVKTLIYFGIIYLTVMLFNTAIINKYKLIDLLQFGKKSENIKLKNPYLCIAVFIVATGMLGYSYYLVTDGLMTSSLMQKDYGIFVTIILGILSTFLIFWSLSGLILKIVMSFKRVYYKGLNSFVLRQISSKVNTTVFSMSVICLMLFLTICIFSSALSLKNSLSNSIKELAPCDLQISKVEGEDTRSFEELLDGKFDFKLLKDKTLLSIYSTEEVTLASTLGSLYGKTGQPAESETLVKLSDYNNLLKVFGKSTISLNDNEYVMVGNYSFMTNIRNEALKNKPVITIKGKNYYPRYEETLNGFLRMEANYAETGFIVLPDSVELTEENKVSEILTANYNVNENNKKQVEKKLVALFSTEEVRTSGMYIKTKTKIYESSIGLGAMVTFVGLYMGIIFLMSSAAILALKELSESTDNKEKFNMLRKIGADENMINKALFKQIFIFFMFPLLLAIIHSIFGIRFANFLLQSMGMTSLLSSISFTAIFIVIIYGGYFLVTYYCSKSIIKEKS